MKIAVLSPTFLPAVGGAEIVLWEVFRRLAERHEILMITPELSPKLLEHYSTHSDDYPFDFGVERYRDRLSFMKIPGHSLSRGLIPPFSLSAVSAVGRMVVLLLFRNLVRVA